MNNSENGTELKTVPLKEGISLQLWDSSDNVVFESSGKWLYPLFEVEDYLHESSADAGTLFLHDRIAGRAAASLIVRMGFRSCFIDTLSRHALDVFRKYGVDCGYSLLVERIQCRTEDLISADADIDSAYLMLRQRAGRLDGLDLEIRGLEAGYDGSPVLRGLDLSLAAGEQLVITGDRGAGKSTLLKALTGALSPASGEILLGGEPLELREEGTPRVGFVNPGIGNEGSPVRALDFVAAGLPGQERISSDRLCRIEIAMRRTGCFQLADRDVHELSGGEQQRVSLARALARKTGLILMDEPASFLDGESKEDFLNLLHNIVRRHMPTIILASGDHGWIESLGWPVRTLREGRLC